MTSTCPVCGCEQGAGLLCASDTARLERDLGDVASIVADLDITMSRQDRVPSSGGAPSSPKGKEDDAGLSAIAHTRTPINFGAVQAADNLTNVLGTWARDVSGDQWRPNRVLLRVYRSPDVKMIGPLCGWPCGHNSCDAMKVWESYSPPPAASQAAAHLLSHIDAIRRHPAVNEMVDEIHDAIAQARRIVDRPADRIYLGQCYFEDEGATCYEEIYGLPGASEVRCRVCGTTHPVEERRDWLMGKARDMLVTIKEASSYLGEIGAITISQASIRGYIHRQKISYKAPIEARRFRLGDLLAVIGDDQERKSA